jgi:hypothetical protein
MACVDLVGPFTIRIPANQPKHPLCALLALKMIDPAAGWFEIVKATNKSATSIQDLFHNTWLARYPRPQFIIFDNGSMGWFKRKFKQKEENYGIKAKPTTSHNKPFTSKCNHWASTQSCQWHAQIIWLGKQSWKSRRTRRQSIWLLTSSLNHQLHGY